MVKAQIFFSMSNTPIKARSLEKTILFHEKFMDSFSKLHASCSEKNSYILINLLGFFKYVFQ
jgi:hypothetical protein